MIAKPTAIVTPEWTLFIHLEVGDLPRRRVGCVAMADLSGHVAAALDAHCRQLGRNGARVPVELELLRNAFTAQGGTGRQELDGAFGAADSGPMWMTAEEVAATLRLSPRKIQSLTVSELLPSVLVGSARRYKAEDVRRFSNEYPRATRANKVEPRISWTQRPSDDNSEGGDAHDDADR
jgi:hypothetical protein